MHWKRVSIFYETPRESDSNTTVSNSAKGFEFRRSPKKVPFLLLERAVALKMYLSWAGSESFASSWLAKESLYYSRGKHLHALVYTAKEEKKWYKTLYFTFIGKQNARKKVNSIIFRKESGNVSLVVLDMQTEPRLLIITVKGSTAARRKSHWWKNVAFGEWVDI